MKSYKYDRCFVGYKKRDTLSETLHKYLVRSNWGKRAIRQLTDPRDLAFIADQRTVGRDMGIMITEMLTTAMIIDRLNDNNLVYISNNFRKMLHSLIRQRKLLTTTYLSITRMEPTDDERKACEQLIIDIRNRMGFLNRAIVPDNIQMTPLQDYIQIIGEKSFFDDMYSIFRDYKNMIEANKAQEPLDEYVTKILDVLKEHHQENTYKERIASYSELKKKRSEEIDIEKANEKKTQRHDDLVGFVSYFTSKFYEALRKCSSNESIGISEKILSEILSKTNHHGYVGIKCAMYQLKPRFTYMKDNGSSQHNFGRSIAIYQTLDEIKSKVAEWQAKDPYSVYDYVSLDIPKGVISITDLIDY